MIAALVLAAALSGPATTVAARVSYVSDGDTIYVTTSTGRAIVRLIGIDAPEIRHGARPGECGGPEARTALRDLLPPGSAVTLVLDRTQDRHDRFGRTLAYVFASGRRGPAGSVNYALVATGAARAYVYDRRRPFRRADLYLAAERSAIRARRGIWSGCRGLVSGS